MSSTGIVRTTSRARVTRYVVVKSTPDASAQYFCGGNTVEEMQSRLEAAHTPGHYRVFDRRPAARGVDVELAGVFIVDASGCVRWLPLPELIAK